MRVDPSLLSKVNEKSIGELLHARKYVVMAVGVLLLSVLILIVGVLPLLTLATETWQDWRAQREKVSALQTKVQELNLAASGEIVQAEDILTAALPSEKPVLALLSGVWEAAAAGQVELSNVQLSPGLISTDSAQLNTLSQNRTSIPGVESLSLAVRVSGPLAGIQSFLGSVEHSLPFTSVEKLELKQRVIQGQPANPPSFDAELLLVTYVFTQSVTATIDQQIPEMKPENLQVLSDLREYQIPVLRQPTELVGGGLEDLFGN
jgi:hypothetical protein